MAHRAASIVAAVAVTAIAAPAAADQHRVAVSGEVAVASTYLWRGVNYHDDRFEPALQPFVQATWRGLTGGVFASLPFAEQSATAYEIDPYVRYARPAGPVELELLYWVFLQPDFEPVDTGHLLQLTTTYRAVSAGVSVDPVRDGGAYYFAALARAHTVGDVTFGGAVRAGISHGGGRDLGLQDVTGTATASYALSPAWYTSALVRVAYGPRMPEGERVIPAVIMAVGFAR